MQNNIKHMLQTVSLTPLVIFLISSAYQDEGSFLSKAAQVNIKEETLKYIKIFSEKKEYKDLCGNLEKYMNYWQKALSVLNEGFREDKELGRKIEEQGIFQNLRVSFSNNADNSIREFAIYLDDNGLGIGYGEGDVFLYFNPIYMCKKFKDSLPEIILEYFKIESEDIKEGYEEDGGLIIPWDQLRIKIIRYDQYLNKLGNINCQYIRNAAEEKVNDYLQVYLYGLNNSPLDEHIDEAMRSYERYLKENSDSKYYELIKNHYLELKRKKLRTRSLISNLSMKS